MAVTGKKKEAKKLENLKFAKPERIWLSTHPELKERWVQERIADDPAILGLGDLILKDKERMIIKIGRASCRERVWIPV